MSTFFCPLLCLWRVEVEGDQVRVGRVEERPGAFGERDVGGEDGASLSRIIARLEH